MVYKIAQALGISGANSGSSNYVTLNANGQLTTIRVSNHAATTDNFGRTPNNVGLIIKTRPHRFRDEKGTDYVEFMYYGDQIAGDATRQREVIEGLRHYIETGSFEKMPQPDVLNTSGAYLAALPSKKSTIRFRANYGSAREEYDERVRNKKVLDKTTGKVKIDAAGKAVTPYVDRYISISSSVFNSARPCSRASFSFFVLVSGKALMRFFAPSRSSEK